MLILLILAAAGLVALLAAAAARRAAAVAARRRAQRPRRAGTLNVSFQGEPTGLDPAVAWEIESWSIEHCLFDQLLTYAAQPDRRP